MLTRSSLQNLLNVAQPLEELYMLEYKAPDDNLSAVFNIESMDSAEEKEQTTYGVSALENVGEAGAVPYDDPGLGYETTYAYQVYKRGVQITREMVRDNKWSKMNDKMKWLARRASYDPVNYGFGVLRNAFSANPSGYANYNSGALALCSDSQTYEKSSVSGTQDNYHTGALNSDNFELACVALAEQKAGDGTLIAYPGKYTLVVPPALQREAVEITESELDPNTANNNVNVYKGSANVVVVPYLGTAGGGSDAYWFLMSPGHKLNFKWRTRPVFDKDIDFDTGVLKYSIVTDYIAGFSDWRCIIGSDGTT